MAVFLISYDLRKPDFDYQPLYDVLVQWKAKHIQDSVWGLNTHWSAEKVFDLLWKHMHSEKDRLFVVTFDKDENLKARNPITPMKNI